MSAGGSASLPCNITAPSEKVSTVLWYRDGKGEPIYTWVILCTDQVVAKHSISTWENTLCSFCIFYSVIFRPFLLKLRHSVCTFSWILWKSQNTIFVEDIRTHMFESSTLTLFRSKVGGFPFPLHIGWFSPRWEAPQQLFSWLHFRNGKTRFWAFWGSTSILFTCYKVRGLATYCELWWILWLQKSFPFMFHIHVGNPTSDWLWKGRTMRWLTGYGGLSRLRLALQSFPKAI